jgi:hypothetical protein
MMALVEVDVRTEIVIDRPRDVVARVDLLMRPGVDLTDDFLGRY